MAGLGSFFCLYTSTFSRDVNLDAIYININSPYYTKLLERKLTAYQSVNSQLIDRDVIFAFWKDGFTVLYIKEFPELNILYSYNRNTQSYDELYRLSGIITSAKNSSNGKFIFVKRLRQTGDLLLQGETIVIDIYSKKIKVLDSSYPFIDFSLSPSGNELLYETEKGIVEFFPDSNNKNIIIGKPEYSDIIKSHSPTIAYMSPNKKKIMLVNGSGGFYRAKFISSGKSWKLAGITSSSEIYWINNNQVICRKGDAGNYSVHVYDVSAQRSAVLVGKSLNTNIQFSNLSKMVSFLQDQIILIYDVRRNTIVNIGLEGEDVFFSPDGSRFISLYLKKLFINNVNMIKRKNMELVKITKQINILYKNLLELKNDWMNEYSPEYIRKKISVYSKIAE